MSQPVRTQCNSTRAHSRFSAGVSSTLCRNTVPRWRSAFANTVTGSRNISWNVSWTPVFAFGQTTKTTALNISCVRSWYVPSISTTTLSCTTSRSIGVPLLRKWYGWFVNNQKNYVPNCVCSVSDEASRTGVKFKSKRRYELYNWTIQAPEEQPYWIFVCFST